MERYVESHKKLELNQEPNVDYLGHPINGYNLIKHAAMGWKNFHFKINPKLNETITNLDYMQNRANNTAISGYWHQFGFSLFWFLLNQHSAAQYVI